MSSGVQSGQLVSERATEVLEAMELSGSDAIHLLMLRIKEERRILFAVKAPKSPTPNAITDLEDNSANFLDSIHARMRRIERSSIFKRDCRRSKLRNPVNADRVLPNARYRVLAHPAIADDLAMLANYGEQAVIAARKVLDDLTYGRVASKLLRSRFVTGDLTGYASALSSTSPAALPVASGSSMPTSTTTTVVYPPLESATNTLSTDLR